MPDPRLLASDIKVVRAVLATKALHTASQALSDAQGAFTQARADHHIAYWFCSAQERELVDELVDGLEQPVPLRSVS